MRVLAVDNNSDTWRELIDLCQHSGLAVTTTSAGEVGPDSAAGFDLIILSGGYWYDDEAIHRATYAGEMELIRHTKVPILGICLGMQLMQVAYSGQVPVLDNAQNGWTDIRLSEAGQAALGGPAQWRVFKNHTRGVLTLQPDFEPLSVDGAHVEIIRHRRQPLLGVQFHPEVGAEPERSRMFNSLVQALLPQRRS